MKDCNLNEILEEIGLRIDSKGNLRKTRNVCWNLGVTPGLALTNAMLRSTMESEPTQNKRVLATHLMETILGNIH